MSKLWFSVFAALLCSAAMCQDSAAIDPSSTARDSLSSLVRLSATCRKGEATLRWNSGRMKTGDFFIVEKSTDSVHFETLSAIGGATDSAFSLTDNALGESTVYYRLRVTGSEGNLAHSGIVSARADGGVSFRFYPNPVDKLLILRATHNLYIQVLDASGVVWVQREVAPGLQIINVSTLQKGNYILQATDRETNKTVSQQLIKG